MRKIIISGVGAIGSAAIALGIITTAPAMATTASVTDQVCLSVATQLPTANAALTSATNAQTAADADFTSKATALATSQDKLVTAAVNFVKAADGTDDAVTSADGSLLDAATADFGAKAVDWSNALSAKNAADRAFMLANMVPDILNAVAAPSTGLSCV